MCSWTVKSTVNAAAWWISKYPSVIHNMGRQVLFKIKWPGLSFKIATNSIIYFLDSNFITKVYLECYV